MVVFVPESSMDPGRDIEKSKGCRGLVEGRSDHAAEGPTGLAGEDVAGGRFGRVDCQI